MRRDPTEFRQRFAAWKEGKQVYKAGLPVYENGKKKKTNLTEKQKLTVDYIYKVLSDAGFDHYSIAGILGNGWQESSFNPDSVNSYGYRGIWQNSKLIQKSVSLIYGDHSLENQLAYIIDWANNNQNVRSKKHGPILGAYAGKYRKKGYGSAEEAGKAFMRMYERPVILDPATKQVIGYLDEDKRILYSKYMLDYLNNNYKRTAVPVESDLIELVEKAPVYTPPVVKPASNVSYDEYTTLPPVPQTISRHSSSESPSYIIPYPDITSMMDLIQQVYSQNPILQPVE